MINYFILTFAILSVFLVIFNLNFISLLISILSLLFSFVLFKKNKRIFLITIVISICTIFTNILILYKNNVDLFKDNNILIGDWLYNDIGGSYIFNDDYTYYQYISSNKSDNYCFGNYEYSYGSIDQEGNIIKQDSVYYYYTLKLSTHYCIINKNKDTKIDNDEFIFSINKNNYEDLMFMDMENNSSFIVTKIKEK